jgi:hypothetical protein
MSDLHIQSSLAFVATNQPHVVSEGEAIRYARERLAYHPEYGRTLDEFATRWSKYSKCKSGSKANGGMSAAYPDKTTFEVKHDQIKDVGLILVGVSLLQKRDGVIYAVTIRSNSDSELHYLSDTLKGMCYRDTIIEAFNAKQGVHATGYFLLRDDPLLLPLLALAG